MLAAHWMYLSLVGAPRRYCYALLMKTSCSSNGRRRPHRSHNRFGQSLGCKYCIWRGQTYPYMP